MRILLSILAFLAGMGMGIVAMLALMGAGMLRLGPTWLVAAAAVALIILPARGLAGPVKSEGRTSALSAGMAMLVWSLAVLISFPLYFPGEREDALSLGFATLEPFTDGRLDPEWATQIHEWLPLVQGTRDVPSLAKAEAPSKPPPMAKSTTRPVPSPVEPAAKDHDEPVADQVVLPTDGRRGSLRIPVTLEGPRRQMEVTMIFDTGASLTTLDRSTLRRLGIRIPDDAPEMTVHTAAGPRTTQVVLLDRLWVGGLEVLGVSLSVCDACATQDAVGLLGLNVSERFLVTVDGAREELVLAARPGAVNRSVDVSPWLALDAQATRWPDGRTEVIIEAENRSRRWIEKMTVAIECDETRYAELRDIGPGQVGRVEVSIGRAAGCEAFQVSLESALW